LTYQPILEALAKVFLSLSKSVARRVAISFGLALISFEIMKHENVKSHKSGFGG